MGLSLEVRLSFCLMATTFTGSAAGLGEGLHHLVRKESLRGG